MDKYDHNAALGMYRKAIRSVLEAENREARIVDLGVGNGETAAFYRDLGFQQVETCDRENHMRPDIAKDMPFHACDFSFGTLPFEDRSVDIFTSYQVIEHLENPWNLVREVSRCLKPNGLFLVSFPSSRDIKSRFRFLFTGDVLHYTPSNGHIAFFTEAVQRKLFKDFTLEKTFGTGMPIPGLAALGLRIPLPGRPIFASKRLFVYRVLRNGKTEMTVDC